MECLKSPGAFFVAEKVSGNQVLPLKGKKISRNEVHCTS